MTRVSRETHRGPWAIQVATVGDGAVSIDVTGLLDAQERAARRWARLRLTGAILCTLTVSGSVILGVTALRWDVQHRRDVQALKLLLQETETRGMCWRAVANRWNRAREDLVTVDAREAWVRGCVEWELTRQDGRARRGARDQALLKPQMAGPGRTGISAERTDAGAGH